VAAHEAGHALQHASGYMPLQVRSAMVPAVQFGSWLGPLIIMAGILLEAAMGAFALGNALAWFGVAVFGMVAVFSFVTLPVELDAARVLRNCSTSTTSYIARADGVNRCSTPPPGLTSSRHLAPPSCAGSLSSPAAAATIETWEKTQCQAYPTCLVVLAMVLLACGNLFQ
jgi:hypothetical protein